MGAALFTPGTPYVDWPSTSTLVTAARLQAIENALGTLGGGIIKLAKGSTAQTFTQNTPGVLVTFQTTEIDKGGSDLSVSGTNYVLVNTTALYEISAYVPFTAATAAGDRGIAISSCSSGTANTSSDPWLVKTENTSRTSNVEQTGGWGCSNIVSITSGTYLYTQAWQHAASGTPTITLGGSTGEPNGYMIVRRVG